MPRKREFDFPKVPFKILAAPEINKTLFQSIIDWAPQSKPFSKNSKLAIALADVIHIADPLKEKIEMLSIDFNRNRTGIQGCPQVSSLSFDRCGEALVVGGSDSLTSIFDVRTGNRIRNLSHHVEAVTAVSFNRSAMMPYLVATGSKDKSIVLHDIRQRFSIINTITQQGKIINLDWSCNQSHSQMDVGDPHSIFLSSSCSEGTISIWSLNDLLQGRKRLTFQDSVSHLSPVKALSWNPLH